MPFVTNLQPQAGWPNAAARIDGGLSTCQHKDYKAWLYGVNNLMHCSGLSINKLSCLAVRGPFGFFNPRNRRSYSTVFVASLLLIAGVEPNPLVIAVMSFLAALTFVQQSDEQLWCIQ